LLGLISLVLANDVPPTTLPKGFLEQLPLLESFNDLEFEQLIYFMQQNRSGESIIKPSIPKDKTQIQEN